MSTGRIRVQLARNQTPERLAAPELERGERLADRLCQELAGLIGSVPRSGASAHSLARDLKVDRNLTHRTCSAIDAASDWMEVYFKLPAPGSLRMLVSAAVQAGGDGGLKASVDAAIDQYERFIREVGGSQSHLQQRLKRTRSLTAVVEEHAGELLSAIETRPRERQGAEGGLTGLLRAHSECSARLMGVQAECVLAIDVVVPGASPGGWNKYWMIGYHGLRALQELSGAGDRTNEHTGKTAGRREPFPVASIANSYNVSTGEVFTVSGYGNLGAAGGGVPIGLVQQFSSDPLPTITSRSEDQRLMHVVDLGELETRAVDLAFVYRAVSKDPRGSSEPVQGFARRIRTPSRVYVQDVYMHRSIKTTGRIWCNGFHPILGTTDPRATWVDRLPLSPRVELLGMSGVPLGVRHWSRHVGAVQWLIQQTGLPMDEFVGYRCEVSYPCWGATYALTFELESTVSAGV